MTETTFDTLEMVQHLKTDGGFSAAQAESVTRAIRIGVTGGVATKADLAEVRADLVEVRADLSAEIRDVRSDLKWMQVVGGALFAVLIFLAGWIVTLLHDLIMAGTGP